MRVMSFLLLLLTTQIVHAHPAADIIISGFVDPALTAQYVTSELIIRKKETATKVSKGDIYTIHISAQGEFKTRISSTEQLFYVSFEFENKKKDNWTGRIYNAGWPRSRTLHEVYLLGAGDSINVQIREDGNIFFSGRGSEKLNCQWELYNIEPVPTAFERRLVALNNDRKRDEAFSLITQSFDFAVAMRTAILDTYKSRLSKEVYTLLYLDAIASVQHDVFARLQNAYLGLPHAADTQRVQAYYEAWSKRIRTSMPDPDLLAQSAYYADMLFEMEYDSLLLYGSRDPLAVKTEFNKLYKRISTRYQGDLRDKLLFIFFDTYGKRCSTQAKEVVDDAIRSMHHARYRSLLVSWKERTYSTFPFELLDANDKLRKLSDYRGKVVVIDFWFTGCGPCQELAATMDTIVEMYKGNKDIVFMSISTDHKNVWLKSVAAGKYTSHGMINLHTSGQGFNHPLIQHYNFKGFPHQLIISKTGELVSSSPPRADVSEAHKQAFVQILNDQLQ